MKIQNRDLNQFVIPFVRDKVACEVILNSAVVEEGITEVADVDWDAVKDKPFIQKRLARGRLLEMPELKETKKKTGKAKATEGQSGKGW